MRVFLTGATGFIGSAVLSELTKAGHEVLGLARSSTSADTLAAAGARVHPGSLDDLESLRNAAASSDAVIHTAFNHDFTNFAVQCEKDRAVIEAMSRELAGTNRPFIITSITGIADVTGGTVAREDDPPVSVKAHPRASSEEAGKAALQLGCKVLTMRIPQVHDRRKQGLWSYLMKIAIEKGVSAYIGEGLNRWPAVHVLDAAALYRLALEDGNAGAVFNAVAEGGVRMSDIASAIGQKLGVPTISIPEADAQEHFGWLATVAGLDLPASSERTRRDLTWLPSNVGMVEDLLNAELES